MTRFHGVSKSRRESQSSRKNDSEAPDDQVRADRGVSQSKEPEVDLAVYGRSACETLFYERATVVSWNDDGGVLLLGVPLNEGQDLLLINNRTSQKQICNVLRIRIRDLQTSEVSVCFPLPNPYFWGASKSR